VSLLVVNAGSSSLKLAALDAMDQVLATATIDGWDRVDASPVAAFVAGLDAAVGAVGHRVVHGGPRHRRAVVVDGRVLADLEEAAALAPLHQPAALAAIRATAAVVGGVPAVACFDTSFHATLSPAASTYALPAEWRRRWDLRRYGFHGLSHAYAVRRAAELVDRAGDPDLRVVSCHLGSGSSLCAAVGGRSVDTTMGFTPLDGLVMATRAGSVDPGLLVWLLDDGRVDREDLAAALEERSGLAGLAGLDGAGAGDLRRVTAAADAGDPAAALAVAVHDHRLRREIGAMAASAGGVDVLAFTGGIGEHQPRVRSAAAAGLGFLGVAVDPGRNEAATGGSDLDVTLSGAAVRTVVIVAREDVEVARQTREVLRAAPSSGIQGSRPIGR
jgi:acetate kinase